MTEEIIVSKGRCPLDEIASLGERTANAEIILHISAVADLKKRAEEVEDYLNSVKLYWSATEDYPETSIVISEELGIWRPVLKISADDIAFKQRPSNPEETFKFRMEESD